VKRILSLTSLWLFVAAAFAQAQTGVCLNNVAQTISNGVIAPIPYASVALCSSGSTAANCVANKVSIYTSAALSTATPTNPFTSDAGGNYFFCAAAGDYALLINSSYGQYFVPDIELVDDWSKGGTMTGALTDAAGFIGPLTGNASTASALAATPSACNPSSYFAYGIAANGNALCNALPAGETLYYQTVQTAGTALPQQPITNFDGTISASNGTGMTNVGLPNTGTAGTYANPSSITTDAQGRVTSVSSSSSVAQLNCLSAVCAGGSTYHSGSTYTNSSDRPVMEEVGMTETGSCSGADAEISFTVNGFQGYGNGVYNQCSGIAGVSFLVPPGATFSVTATQVDGGGSTSITSWLEVKL
jgi:hypothetical protein